MSIRILRGERAPLPQFVFPFVPFDLSGLLEEVRRERVPEAPAGIPVGFVEQSPFACIRGDGEGWASIDLHPILNRPDAPREVVGFVLMHELLHTVVPGRRIRGKYESHPPEFGEEELRRSPPGEKQCVWAWIHFHWWPLLKRKPEGLHVVKRWHASRANALLTLDEIRDLERSVSSADVAGFRQPRSLEGFDAGEGWVEAA